ncbi:MAG TPA: SMC-Scp complex subunit ScpB [Longimicrobiales bacterium]
MQTTQIVEALLFASDAPLTAADIARADENLDEDAVEAAVQELRAWYEANARAYQIYEVAGGYQILTLPEFAPYLERFATVPQSSKLSQAALEALAVIAYRQPIDRSEVEEIRGVASSGVLRTLQDRNLIDIVGRGEGLGRPMLYGTTQKFLEHFGFRSLDDLPRQEELPVVLTGVEPPPLRRADDPQGLIEPTADAEAQADDEAAALAGREVEEPSLDEAADTIVALASSSAELDADGLDFEDAIDDGPFDSYRGDDDPDGDDDDDFAGESDDDTADLDTDGEFGTDDDMDGPVEDDLAPLADEDEDTTTSRFTSAP